MAATEYSRFWIVIFLAQKDHNNKPLNKSAPTFIIFENLIR